MKTTKVILIFAMAFLFSASYIVRAKPIANEKKGNAVLEDSAMTNHNHSGSSMMNGNKDGMMMNHNNGDSTMMGQGDMMAMMQKCESMAQRMKEMQKQMSSENCCAVNGHVTNKNDNSFADPGAKKGSYGYFQYQREMNKKIDGEK